MSGLPRLDDESFAAGQNIGCSVVVLWGNHGFVGRAYEPPASRTRPPASQAVPPTA